MPRDEIRRRRFRTVTILTAVALLVAGQLLARTAPIVAPALTAAGVGFAAAGGGLVGLVVAIFGAGLAPLDTPLRVAFGVCALAAFERSSHAGDEVKRLSEASLMDGLTGLCTYTYFDEALRHEVGRVRRYGGACSLIVLDLDRFKEFNDSLGHAAGNELLARVGDSVRRAKRETDLAARFGGEELVILVPGSARQAVALAERIRRDVAQIVVGVEHRRPAGTTVSAGVAEYPEDAGTADELFAAADAALYAAKRSGRDRVLTAARGDAHAGTRMARAAAG